MGNQSASEMLNSLFAGVDIIIDKRLQSVSYDSTIICTIVDDSNRKNGIYRATDGSTIYTVYSDLDSYRNGEQVRVQIPMGDYSQKKYILGKYVSDSDSTPLTYISPTDKILNVSDNLLGKSLSKQSFGLRANGNEELLHIFSKTIDSKYLNMQKNNIYTDIILKANFKTLLSTYDLIEGNFGLRLDLKIRPSVNSSITIHRIMELDSSEMFGNPYSFTIKSPQSKVFKINTLGLVETIALCLYQNNNFKKSNGDLLRRIEGSGQDNDIIVSDIVLGMGCDLGDVEDNTLQVYCEDDPQYNYLNPTEDTNLKNIGLLWLNKDENGNFIGFSDGIYDYDYDELEYLKKSQTDTRLVAQKGKENVPLDKTSLGLAANIEEAVPNIVSALKVVSTDMISRLRELKSYVDSVSTYTDNIDSLITTSGNRSLMNIVNDIYEYLGYTEENSEWKEGLIQQYAGVLKYGYETAFGMTHKEAWKDWWPILPDKNNYNIKIYNLFNKIETNINWLFDKTENFNKGEKGGFYEIDTTYSGYLSMYNTYLIRIQDLLAKMFGYLGFLEDDKAETYSNYKHYKKYFPKGIITDSTEDITDFKKLCNYKSKTKDKFKAYTSPDLSSYDNKYCIYWFRYEQDYEPPQEEQILDKGWRRLKRKGDFFQKVKTFDTSKQNSETYIKDKFYYINNANEDNTDLEDKYVLESADAPDTNKTYYKKFLKGDSDGINVGLSSVWKNEDGENILNNEGKKLHAPRVSNGNGILQRYMAKNYQKEQYKAVLFYNHEMFESNILEFSNKDPVPDETTADQGDILIFKHLDNSSDSFQVYGITNYLMDASDEHRVRTIQVGYDGLYAKDNALVSGQLYWYVPNVSTMLTVDLEDLLDNTSNGKGFTLDETKSSFQYIPIKINGQTGNSLSGEIKNFKTNTYYYICKDDKSVDYNKYLLLDSKPEDNELQCYEKSYSEYCFYKQVIATKKEDADNYEYDWEKWDFTDSEKEIDSRQFWYKIKPYYESNCQNNYIKCEFQKSNLEEIVHGTELFTFGVKGTSGTKYTLAISNRGSINAASGKTGAQLKAVLKDYDNNELPLVESLEGDDTKPIEIEWVGYTATSKAGNVASQAPDLNYLVSNTELNFDTGIGCYGIIKVKGKIELQGTQLNGMQNSESQEPSKEGEERVRQVDLSVLHSIPFSGTGDDYSDCLYISGPTQIIYNNTGTLDNNSMFNKQYELFAKKDCEIEGKKYKKDELIADERLEWNVVYCIVGEGKKFTIIDNKYVNAGSNADEKEKRQKEKEFYEKYMPHINQQSNTLVPAPLYLSGLNCYAIVEAKLNIGNDNNSSNDIYLWRQPIIILQNKYASALLNDWDGSFQIDEKNGTILGTMFGAGRKNTNNQFEGVLMGDVAVGTGMNVGFQDDQYGTANQTGIGLYGFHEGAQSFGFNIDGTAFLGKSGTGRIIFNGNSGTIASANWFENGRLKKDPNTGKITIDTPGTSGMCIDLDDGHIDAYNFKLTSKNIYFNSNPIADENYYFRFGSDGTSIDAANGSNNDNPRTNGFMSMNKKGDLVIRVNSLYITGQLGGANLLHQTAPKKTIPRVKTPANSTTGTKVVYERDSDGYVICDYDVSKWSKDAAGLEGRDKAGPSSDEKGTCIFVSGGNHKASQTIVAKKGFYTVSGYICRVQSNNVASGDEATLTISTNIGSAASDSNGSNTIRFTKDEWKYFEYTFEIEQADKGKNLTLTFSANANYYLYHAKLEEGSIATYWTPSNEDNESNVDDRVERYNKYLAQDEIFNKLAIDPETGETMVGIWLVDPEDSASGKTELYISATYMATGILRSSNFNGTFEVQKMTQSELKDFFGESVYNSMAEDLKYPQYRYTLKTKPTRGVYFNLDEGKMWAAKFELNAWNSNEGLYLNSHPSSRTAISDYNYYLRLGNSTDYITFSGAGEFKIAASTFILNAYESGVGGLFLDSNPDKNKSYFRVGTQGSNELCFKRDEAGTGTEFFITTTNLTLNAGTKGGDYYLGLFSSDQGENDTFTIGDSDAINTWRIIAGKKFGVTSNGDVYAENAYVRGDIEATSITTGALNAHSGTINNLVAGQISTLDGKITLIDGKVTALEGDFKTLSAKVITSTTLYSSIANLKSVQANEFYFYYPGQTSVAGSNFANLREQIGKLWQNIGDLATAMNISLE